MIVTNKISKYFGDHKVLDEISEEIQDGEVVVIIGPSGSGKSTFLRCLNGLEEVTSGSILVDGQDITQPDVNINQVRENLGMVFQHFNLFPHKTVLENLTLAPKLVKDKDAKEKALRLLVFWTRKMLIQLPCLGDKNKGLPLSEPCVWIQR